MADISRFSPSRWSQLAVCLLFFYLFHNYVYAFCFVNNNGILILFKRGTLIQFFKNCSILSFLLEKKSYS